MRGERAGIIAGFLVALALSVVYVTWSARHASAAQLCDACRRQIHARSRTMAEVGGRRQRFCCPACALTAHLQSGKAVRLTEVTDFDTDEPLEPRHAWFVKGSDVNLCSRMRAILDGDMQPAVERFDRCAPGILAFASQDSAARMAAVHGGKLLSYDRLALAAANGR